MSINNVLVELWPTITNPQKQKVVQAIVATQGRGPGTPEGLNDQQLAELRLKQWLKSVVKGADRKANDGALTAINAQTDLDFPEA